MKHKSERPWISNTNFVLAVLGGIVVGLTIATLFSDDKKVIDKEKTDQSDGAEIEQLEGLKQTYTSLENYEMAGKIKKQIEAIRKTA